MPCREALITKPILLKPSQSVDQALAALKKAGATFAPVLEDDGTLAGLFSVGRVLENTLPVSVAVAVGGEGAAMNVTIPSAPGMAKRFQKYRQGTVSEMMQRPARAVYPDTPLDAAVRHIRENGEPAAVIDPATGSFIGIVTENSILEALEKMAG